MIPQSFARWLAKPSTGPLLARMLQEDAKIHAAQNEAASAKIRGLLQAALSRVDDETTDADGWCVIWAALRHATNLAEARIHELDKENRHV